jgi:hypothetical protein
MADDNPLQNLPNVSDVVEEVVTLSTDPMRLVAKKAVNAYVQATVVTMAIPLLTLGGPTSISQAPVRKPDVESTVPNTSTSHVTQEGSIMLEAFETSAGSQRFPSAYRLVKIPKKPESA